MTDALRALRYIQISNPENTPGEAEAAVEILFGTLTPPADDIVVLSPEDEERNSLARFHANAFEVGQIANLVFSGDLNFRHIIWWLSMAIRGNVTPTQPDVTNQPLAYLWTFEPSLTAANTPDQTNGIDTFTMEYGDNLQAYETEFCFATRLEISGAPNAPCRVTANISARQQTDTTKTGSLNVQAVQRAPFNLAKYYRDSSWANMIGATPTQKTGVMKGFTWSLDTMFVPRFTGDGTLYFTQLDEDRKAPELRLVLVRGTESDVFRSAYEDQSTVFVMVKPFGATVLDTGQSNPPYLALQGAYTVPTWPAWGEDQGMATVEVPLVGVYDSTGAKMLSAKVLTNLSAYPT